MLQTESLRLLGEVGERSEVLEIDRHRRTRSRRCGHGDLGGERSDGPVGGDLVGYRMPMGESEGVVDDDGDAHEVDRRHCVPSGQLARQTDDGGGSTEVTEERHERW